MPHRQKIAHLVLDGRTLGPRSAQIEHERQVAIYDLIEENYFAPHGDFVGPYRVRLGAEEARLSFDVRAEDDRELVKIVLPLAPLRRVIRDYFLVCDAYFEAIKTSSPSRIEAIDMGRRSLHNEGAEILRGRLHEKVEMDAPTSRRLFTLICTLHIRG
jgi:uncharacterized protein (UPF0262 family)